MKDEINIAFPGQILDYVDTKEHLLELFNYITKKDLDYKSRIDKATEYIKNHTIEWVDEQFEVHNVMVKVDNFFNPQHVIWLLNGGDENDN